MEAARAAIAKPAGSPSAPAIPTGQAAPGAVSATAKANGAAPPVKDGAVPEMATDEEIATLSTKAQARFHDLTSKLRSADEQAAGFKAPAEQYHKITAFMDQFNLTTDDMVMAYDIVARMKNDPVSAFQKLTPLYQELARRAGAMIPDDLKEKVTQGFMDEKTAREVAKTRADKTLADERLKRAEERHGRDTMVSTNANIQQAVADWDTQQVSKDPDFERKRPLVEHTARSIMAKEGRAKDPDAAVDVLARALKAVNDNLTHFTPKPQATPRVPASAGNPATSSVAVEPKSLREAAMQGLKGTYKFGN